MAARDTLRRLARLAWWSVTLQLPSRLRARREAERRRAAAADRLAEARSGRRPEAAGWPAHLPSPLVSIVVRTTSGRGGFLREALDSIAAQTYPTLEALVVEDGSDTAGPIVEALRARAPRLVLRHLPLPKLGRCMAGNRGLAAARGAFLGFLDDDDLLLPDHVATLVRELLEHPDCPAAYAGAIEVATRVNRLQPLDYSEEAVGYLGTPFSLGALWTANLMPIQAVLFRRELYGRFGGLDPELDALEDWDLWLRYAAERDFRFVEGPTSVFRVPADAEAARARAARHDGFLPLVRTRQEALRRRLAEDPATASRLAALSRTEIARGGRARQD